MLLGQIHPQYHEQHWLQPFSKVCIFSNCTYVPFKIVLIVGNRLANHIWHPLYINGTNKYQQQGTIIVILTPYTRTSLSQINTQRPCGLIVCNNLIWKSRRAPNKLSRPTKRQIREYRIRLNYFGNLEEPGVTWNGSRSAWYPKQDLTPNRIKS